MLSAFHSAVIDVSDFEVAVRDYSRLLGQDPLRIERQAQEESQAAIFELANTALELRAPVRPSPGVGDEESPSGSEPGRFGLAGIRLVCELADPTEALAARGVRIASSREAEAECADGLALRRWRAHRIDLEASRGIPVELISEETIEPAVNASLDGSPVDPAARVRALDHVVVLSPDPEATRAFYGEGLGIRLALDKRFESRGVRLLFFRVGGTTIEVGARLGFEAEPDRRDRFGGLAWQVVEIDAIHARLAADGFDVSGIREGNKPGTRVCTVRDPVHEVPTLLIEPVS